MNMVKSAGMPTRHPDRFGAEATRLVVAALCLGTAGLTLAATRYGAGLSPDSVTYISTARNLASENGLRPSWSSNLTEFPPGFPAVLVTGDPLGVDAETVARAANVVAAAAVVLLSFLLLRRHVRSSVGVLFGTAVVALSPALLLTFRMAWSEPLFLVVALVFLIQLENLARRSAAPNWATLVLPACLVWVGFLLRYAGLTLLVTGFVVLALSFRQWGARAAFARAALFGVVGASLPVAWMIRNAAGGAGPLGRRASATRGLITNTKQAVATVSQWIAPEQIPLAGRVLILGFVGVMAVVGMRRGVKHRVLSATEVRAMVTMLAFLVVYAGYVVVAANTVGIDPLGHRLLSPLVVPLVVVVVWAIDRLRATVSKSQRRTVVVTVGVLAGLCLLYPTVSAVRSTTTAALHGSGYAADEWQHSELAKAIVEVALTELVYSNEPYGLYVGSRRDPLYLSPRSRAYASNDTVNDSAEFVRTVACGDVLLAWREARGPQGGQSDRQKTSSGFLVGLGQLRQLVHLEEIRSVRDGKLYRVTALRRRAGTSTTADDCR